MSLTETKSQDVGSDKTMTSTATLYRDGRLSVDVWTECNNMLHGLRGCALVIVYDADNNAIGVSQEIRCATRGGLLDLFTVSSGRQLFVQQFPQEIGQRAVGLDILQADETIFGGERILRKSSSYNGAMIQQSTALPHCRTHSSVGERLRLLVHRVWEGRGLAGVLLLAGDLGVELGGEGETRTRKRQKGEIRKTGKQRGQRVGDAHGSERNKQRNCTNDKRPEAVNDRQRKRRKGKIERKHAHQRPD
ncbi:hypothetical protein B0H10DRAFT_1939152 [Mycena sp. CBHHK59/15]|nr:hypothetical protein B0H10DRAFT_1939152 [Mycena sp. CBHHK59/15]